MKYRRRKIQIKKFLELFVKQKMQNNIKLEIKSSQNKKKRFFALAETEFKAQIK